MTVLSIRLGVARPYAPSKLLYVLLLSLLFLHIPPAESDAADLSYRDKDLSELISLVNDSDFEVRHKATEAIEFRTAELQNRPAEIANLIRQLDDKYARDRWVISRVLKILKAVGKPAAPLLLAELEKDAHKKEGWRSYKMFLSSIYIEIDPRDALPWAISFLKTADSREINIPVESYAKLGKPAVGPLTEILTDDSASIRTKNWVIFILGQMGDRDEQVTAALTRVLEDPNQSFHRNATEALSLDVQTLLDELENPKIPRNSLFTPQQLRPQIVAETIRRLGELKDRRAIIPLINKLDEFDEVLVDALKRIGDLPLDPLAASLAQREDPAQKRYRFFGGTLMGPSLLAGTRRKSATLLAFTENQADAVPYLIRALEDDNIFVRIEATKSLGVIGSPAIDPLIEALSSEKLWVREGAVKALAAIRYSEGIEALQPLLQDESWYIRYVVGSTLAAEGKPGALPHLTQALETEANPLVRAVMEEAKRDIRLRSWYRFLRIPSRLPIG